MHLPGFTGAVLGESPMRIKATFGPFSADRNFNPLADVPGVAGDVVFVAVLTRGVAHNQTMTGYTQIDEDLHASDRDDFGVKCHYRVLNGTETDIQVVHDSGSVWIIFAVLVAGAAGRTINIVDALADAQEGDISSGAVTLSARPTPSLAMAIYGFCDNGISGPDGDALLAGNCEYSATPEVTLSDLAGSTHGLLKATLFNGSPVNVTVDLDDIGGVFDVQALLRFGAYWT